VVDQHVPRGLVDRALDVVRVRPRVLVPEQQLDVVEDARAPETDDYAGLQREQSKMEWIK
jgi:hypothetical protein